MGSSLSVTELLAPFRADPEGSGVFSDFDGTLAPIVDDPAAALPLPGVVDVLGRLAGRYGRVGVISGRPASFLRQHLGGHGLFLSGLYGLEYVDDDGEVRAIEEAERWRAVIDDVVAAADAAGLPVERKGLAVTVHYRTDRSRERAVKEWVDEQAGATDLAVHPARMSYELRPPMTLDKGTVLAKAAEGRRQVCFLGDDTGDLSAFDALDRMADEGVTVVKVGVESPEAPEALLERADVTAEGPEGSLRILESLLGPSSSGPLRGREAR
ncbi:MAG TPA: trehalose-phosphatase [Acidimicrobiales bacterium]|nr:trehalose-phosphatase [Acidimicrobiales bacterium]